MPLFSFKLNTLQITQTRSVHKDTVYASVTVLVVGESPLKFMGNLNNGTFSVGQECDGVAIPTGSSVVFNYLLVNAGSSSTTDIGNALQSVGSYLASTPGLNLPPLASSVQSEAVIQASAALPVPIFKPGSCDGVVAAEQNSYTYDELISATSRLPYFMQATHHTGPKISNCNSQPSAYLMDWSMMNVVQVPNVVDLILGKVGESGTAAQVLSQVPVPWQALPAGSDPNKVQVDRQSLAPGYQPRNVTMTLTVGPIQ